MQLQIENERTFLTYKYKKVQDIDDVILNASGFYVGCGLKWAIDKMRQVISGGIEEKIPYFPRHLNAFHNREPMKE